MEQMSLSPISPPKLKAPSSKWRLLVVDDEIGMGESLRLLLSHLGYEVAIADSGELAIEQLRSKSFDLVVTDLVMDGINGYDILDFVNHDGIGIPVIVLTGLDSVDAAVKALKQGAYDFILKPFDFDNFKASIRRAIEKRQLEMTQRLQKQRIDAAARIARAVTSTLKLDEIFQIIVQQSCEFFEFDSAALALLNRERHEMDLLAISVQGQERSERKSRFSLNHPVFATLLSRRIPLLVPDLSSHQEFKSLDLPLMEDARSCALVPLVTKDRLVGALLYACRVPFVYGQLDLEFLIPIADQVSVAVDNARLLELELRRSRQLEILHHVGRQLTSALVVERLLERAILLLKDHFQYRHIEIFYFDENRTQLRRCHHPEDSLLSTRRSPAIPLETGIVGKAALTGQTVLMQSADRESVDSTALHESTAELAVPLKNEGEILGVLYIEDVALERLPDEDLVMIEAVASQISLAWKNARLFRQIRESKLYLELVLNAADDISILSIDRNGRIVTYNAGSERLLGVPLAEAVSEDIGKLIQGKSARKILKTLKSRTNRESWEGELQVLRPDKKEFWAHMVIRPIEPDVDQFVGFLIVLTDITRRIELENELRQLTVTDDLTGLLNQRSFSRQIKREIQRTDRKRSPFSLCIFDLDKFKTYNDKHGHLAGDEILSRVGALISGTIRAGVDLAFRYGGDEFVILLPDTGLNEALHSIERLRKAVAQEFNDQISISAGLAEFTPGIDEKEFIESVDKLMYLAKRRGGGRVMATTAEMCES
jgi:diguanylate cyclase (GGDEF)-like protein/PAS domain S-box-containing protein